MRSKLPAGDVQSRRTAAGDPCGAEASHAQRRGAPCGRRLRVGPLRPLLGELLEPFPLAPRPGFEHHPDDDVGSDGEATHDEDGHEGPGGEEVGPDPGHVGGYLDTRQLAR